MTVSNMVLTFLVLIADTMQPNFFKQMYEIEKVSDVSSENSLTLPVSG